MSYKSPIEIISGKMKNQLDNDIYSVVQSYGIKVDKGELINALEYDRNQYKQGYADAKAELERKKGQWIGDFCSCCGLSKYYFFKMIDDECTPFGMWNFCPNCGANMRDER